jgi:hypothetical protein
VAIEKLRSNTMNIGAKGDYSGVEVKRSCGFVGTAGKKWS